MNPNDTSIFDIEPTKAEDPFAISEDSEFNFDTPHSNDSIDLNDLNEETADPAKPGRRMSCICPTCAEKTEVDLAQVSENGFVTTCSSCSKQIHIIRESCACRAKRKSFEINCADCGTLLDHHAHCHSCGKLFPDYFVSFNPDDARHKARNEFFSRKWAAIRDFEFSFKPAVHDHSRDHYTPGRTIAAIPGASHLPTRKATVLAIRIIVALVLIAAGVFAYNSHKADQVYAKDYFKVLYGIKSGIDTNLATCAAMKTEWESLLAAGRSFPPSISKKDEADSLMLRSDVDKLMVKMNDPPKRFSKANENLAKMYSIYLATEGLMQSKPRSPQELGSSVDILNKKTGLASQELRKSLPDSLKQELEKAKLKYRGMKDF